MTTEHKKTNDKNILEWAVFGISLLLVIVIIAYLVYETYTHQPSPPDITVSYSLSSGGSSGYEYHLVIENKGGETAEEVVIELVSKQNERIVERAEMRVPFLPMSSKREGWVNFVNDPALADTVLSRVVSFKKP